MTFRLAAVWRAPATHFSGLGVLLFTLDAAGVAAVRSTAEPRPQVIIPAWAVTAERRAWIGRTGRAPTAAEEVELVDIVIADELLHQEARALGLDRTDPVVYRRLVENMRFLAIDEGPGAAGVDAAARRVGLSPKIPAADASAGDLDAQARGLDLDRGDEIVRRRLVQRMRLVLEARARTTEPTPADLKAYLENHAAGFTAPARADLHHVFLSRRRHGARLDAVAVALRDALAAEGVTPAAAAGRGDPFPVPARLFAQSGGDLEGTLGRDVAAAAFEVPVGAWTGPVPSPYGAHLVWVHARQPARRPPLTAVFSRVREAFLAERAERALAAALADLRGRYDVRVAQAPASGRGR
jgi:hypothetical protein